MHTIWKNIVAHLASVRAYRRNRLPGAAADDSPDRAEPIDVQSLTIVAAGLAHDINNLLALVIGNSQLALQQTQDAESHRRWAEVLEAGKLAADLTQQFVALGRHTVLEVQPVSPNQVIRDSLELLARLAGNHVTIQTSLAKNAGTIRVNAIELLQVLMNLVLNARDAMPSGGTLAIETDRKCLTVAANNAGPRPGCYVVLTVTDSGSGIDEGTKSRVFEAFFSTKVASQTTGLGLAIVAAVMRKSGGDIDISSALGAGTAFHLYFPAADPVPT